MRNEIAALRARLPQFESRVKSAQMRVCRALELGVSGYVALSGGKDSTVVLDLVRSIDPDYPAVFSDDEWNLPETDIYIESVPNTRRIAALIRHSDWFTSWEHGGELPAGTEWVNAPHNDGLQTYARQQRWELVFLGLRQEESNTRQIHLRQMGPLFLAAGDHTWHCNPIHNWTWQDVWAYIVSRDLIYNLAYDRLEEIGVPPEQQRIGPFAVERVLGFGQLAILKRGWPDMYNRFVERYPQASQYT